MSDTDEPNSVLMGGAPAGLVCLRDPSHLVHAVAGTTKNPVHYCAECYGEWLREKFGVVAEPDFSQCFEAAPSETLPSGTISTLHCTLTKGHAGEHSWWYAKDEEVKPCMDRLIDPAGRWKRRCILNAGHSDPHFWETEPAGNVRPIEFNYANLRQSVVDLQTAIDKGEIEAAFIVTSKTGDANYNWRLYGTQINVTWLSFLLERVREQIVNVWKKTMGWEG